MMNDDFENLWGTGSIRAFISHVSEDKKVAYDLKKALGKYGIAAFVAHDDIEPMREWENEIVRALDSMDLLVALLTPTFSNSKWTDQEVGFAFGRKVPALPVRYGKDPYGLLNKYQAIPAGSDISGVAAEIFEFAFTNQNLAKRAVDSYIESLSKSPNFASSNRLAAYMPRITSISAEQETALVGAFNANGQVASAHNIRSHVTTLLQRTTGNSYEINDLGHLRIRQDRP